jgi:hypothetical protein
MSTPVNCTDSELSTFLRGLAEGYLPTYYSDTNPYAPSRLNPIASKSYTLGSKTVLFRGFPSLRMSKSLTADRGAGGSMSSVAGSRAKTSAYPEREPGYLERGLDCGESFRVWFAKFDLEKYSWKTPQLFLFGDLEQSLEIWPRWGLMQNGVCWELTTQEVFTAAKESGLLPTVRKSGQSRAFKCYKREDYHGNMEEFLGRNGYEGWINPSFSEAVMMWPDSWTDISPLETDKFQQWLLSHGEYSAKE